MPTLGDLLLGRKSGGLLDLIKQYGSGVKQRVGLLADDPAEFTRQALLDVVPNSTEAQAAQNRLMGGEVDPQAYAGYIRKSMDLGSLLASIRVYHGSPHKFDKFDLSKIGTGEGNQMYGHGAYVAEAPEVAERYARDLAMRAPTQNAAQVRAEIKRVKAEEPAGWLRYQQLKQLQADLKSIRSGATREPQLYEADLRWPDAAREAADPMGPQHFLDWDKPLSQQPEAVRKAWQQTRKNLPPNAAADLGGDFSLLYGNDVTPGDFFGTLKAIGGRSDFGEQLLRQQGIPGIRYLDAGSRSGGAGTHNYVVFDDSLIKLLTRNGAPIK